MAVTLKDIAKEAGINVGSVSQVLNNHPKAEELRAETRERIIKAATKLGYHRNELARAIVKGSSNVIAFITSDMGAIEYTGRIQKSVFETASALGYSVSFYQLTKTNKKEIIRKILEWKVAGIIFHTKVDERIEIMKEADKNNIKVGIINHTADKLNCIGATSDDFSGAVEAIRHLASLGHSRIAFVTCSGETEFLNNRHNGYLEGMRMFAPGQEPQVINIESNDYNSWSNSEKFSGLLNAPEAKRPSAVFCAMDSLAMAFCRGAYVNGRKIPEDFSVVGFGDLEFTRYSVIPLTTISQPFEQMSTVVTQKVIGAIKNKQAESENIRLNTELVVRQSTIKINV